MTQVQCKYASSGCGWRGRLEDSATHQAVCPVVENLTLARKLEIANRRIGDLDNEKKTWQKETSALKETWAKLRSKEASVLHLQKENAVMLRQARESTTERNKMVARIKEQMERSPSQDVIGCHRMSSDVIVSCGPVASSKLSSTVLVSFLLLWFSIIDLENLQQLIKNTHQLVSQIEVISDGPSWM
eukprot:Skav220170  [mRNA]  locus=scaffold564:491735:492619:+ [translate_table: standard]